LFGVSEAQTLKLFGVSEAFKYFKSLVQALSGIFSRPSNRLMYLAARPIICENNANVYTQTSKKEETERHNLTFYRTGA